MKQPLGVILAGGQAQRMGGGDKGRLMLGGQSLLARVIDRLEPQVAGLALNANGDAARFGDLKLPIIPDSIVGFAGPLAGVLAGLEWAAEQGGDSIVTAAADTPFFPCDLVPRLILAGLAHPDGLAVAATPDGLHATFGIWPVSLRDELAAFLTQGGRKMRVFTENQNAAIAQFPAMSPPFFFNINTPDDLTKAAQWL